MLTKKYVETKETCAVTFEYLADKAEQVELFSAANGWQPITMSRLPENDLFATTVELPANQQIEFRYRLDGREWLNDPAADAYAPNPFGSQNGIVNTMPG